MNNRIKTERNRNIIKQNKKKKIKIIYFYTVQCKCTMYSKRKKTKTTKRKMNYVNIVEEQSPFNLNT